MAQAEVESVVSMCTAENVDQLLLGSPDFVLDAIDNIHTKVGRDWQTPHRQQRQPLPCMSLHSTH